MIILRFFIFLLFSVVSVFPQPNISANPDYLSSGMSWTTQGIPSIKIGDEFSFNRLYIGGMVEVRNEKHFDQEILPNHNWRGLGSIAFTFYKQQIDSSQFWLNANVWHENAHPTMGITEPTAKAYELIYDNSYRRMILNSAGFSGCFSTNCNRNTLFARANYNFYFLSKNTPELSSSRLGLSNGFSIGAEDRYRTGKNTSLFFSIYDRIILKGFSTDTDYVYVGNNSTLTHSLLTYPVITQINTFVVKTGVSIHLSHPPREIDVYQKLLYGYSYGFIDSRDTRFTITLGIETSL